MDDIQTGFNQDNSVANSSFSYADFWKRAIAYFVDTIILVVGAFVIGLIMGFLEVFIGMYPLFVVIAGFLVSVTYLACLLLFGVAYLVCFHSSKRQATPGKMLIGIKVVDYNGNRIGFLRSLARYFSMFLSGFFLIGFLIAGFTKRKQALHDFICKTYVVNAKDEILNNRLM